MQMFECLLAAGQGGEFGVELGHSFPYILRGLGEPSVSSEQPQKHKTAENTGRLAAWPPRSRRFCACTLCS